jgi:RimJ/RimL family protein N-acetyltransferase
MDIMEKPTMTGVPKFAKPAGVTGHHLLFRQADVSDAAFIVALRTDEKLSRHLSATSSDLDQQVAWLQRYQSDNSQIYFVIQNRNMVDMGTVRLYDRKESSFCWGSWIIKEGQPPSSAIESALIVYHFALSLGFERAHFDVRKANQSVWRFHERFGAIRVGESDADYFFEMPNPAILRSLVKYERFLPNKISVEY